MQNRTRPDVRLDHLHAEAVCRGIGERLRESLQKNWDDAPKKLNELFDRLSELDIEHAPSIVPSSHEAF